jgi:signal transduction histidine kinase
MFESFPARPSDKREPLTLIWGSYRLAYQTFWRPWTERSGPILGHLLLSVILSAVVGAFIALGVSAFDQLPVLLIFRSVLPYAESIGITIMLLQGVGHALFGVERLRRMSGAARGLYWGVLSSIGAYVGFLIATYLRFGSVGDVWNPAASVSLTASMGLGLIICVVIYQVAASSVRASLALERADREHVRSLAAEAMAAQANLKLLQAQIEPHFLFNTLANVVGLIDTRPGQARTMLEDLIRYLRATLALTRQDSTTLGAEADLIEAYLSIFRVRMGQRLSFSIEIDAGLRGVPIAPMLLQPIVENALKHGLEPKIDGGTVSLRATREGDQVRLDIADSGLGFEDSAAGGFGLANVRERLRLLYGEGGHLEIRENAGGGTLVTVVIPQVTGT